jgi:hypothetical protein
MRTLTGAVALLCAAGCHCGGDPGADAGRLVQVARFRTLVSDSTRENVPFDLTQQNVDPSNVFFAQVRDDAGFYVIYADVIEPGAAEFHDFPAGPFFMTLNNYSVYTSQDAIDLGVVTLGRSGSTLTDGTGVTLALQLDGLSPWVPFSDVLQLTSANAGYVAVNAQSYVAAQPDAGSTSAAVAVDYFSACSTQRGGQAPLIDADAGDSVIVTQLTTQTLDGGLFQLATLVRSGTLSAFTMADHQTTNVSGTVAEPPLDHFTLTLRQSAFAALLPQVSTAAVASGSTVTIGMLPYGANDGAYTAGPSLAVLRAQDPSIDVTVSFDTGDPFPTTWSRMVTARYATQVNVEYPDGGSRPVGADILVADTLSALLSSPITPRVSPVKNVTVNGGPGDVRAQIPRTPVLTWSKPDIGTPTSYGVQLVHLSRVGPTIVVAQDDFFEVTQTRIEIPFGELSPGEEYVFAISAYDNPGADVTKAPFKGALPFGAATTLTALFRVDPTKLQP